ncbi:hypothetical protein GPEL0_01r0297 [Geoanaerobacter pelophilus]|uniref:Uncharacterized protein n=1 Tax=Geoanaerobacter pelophilus TaxID=60036 RepID=A0ABQ0ME90_9BACT|nr:hypothetical protein GPEL0_01r0297 [Geoanaerobacter pelophilus]
MPQITLGIVFGGMGLLLAAPMTAALFVVGKTLYVEDLLRDEA